MAATAQEIIERRNSSSGAKFAWLTAFMLEEAGVGLAFRGLGWLWKARQARKARKVVRSAGLGADVRGAEMVREIAHGEKVADIVAEGARLTRATGLEHAVVSLKDGRRVIVRGGADGIDLAGLNVRRLLGHSHPPGSRPGASPEDFEYLSDIQNANGSQTSSYLLEVEDFGHSLGRFWGVDF